MTDDEIDAKRGTVESVEMPARGERKFLLWPRFDGEDRVEMVGVSTGVLLAIQSNGADENAAVFLTVEEIERLAREARWLHAARLHQMAEQRAHPEPAAEAR